MKTHKEVLEEALKDPEVKKEYKALEPEFSKRREEIKARQKKGGK